MGEDREGESEAGRAGETEERESRGTIAAASGAKAVLVARAASAPPGREATGTGRARVERLEQSERRSNCATLDAVLVPSRGRDQSSASAESIISCGRVGCAMRAREWMGKRPSKPCCFLSLSTSTRATCSLVAVSKTANQTNVEPDSCPKQREAVVEEKSAGIGRAALWADLEQARVLWDKVVACVQGCFEVDLPQLGLVFGHAIGDGFVGGQPDACEGCACEEEALLLHCC